MAKGDVVTVYIRGIDSGFRVEARQNGRTVDFGTEKDTGLTWLVVKELTRGGTVVTEDRFSVADVLAVHKVAKEIQ